MNVGKSLISLDVRFGTVYPEHLFLRRLHRALDGPADLPAGLIIWFPLDRTNSPEPPLLPE